MKQLIVDNPMRGDDDDVDDVDDFGGHFCTACLDDVHEACVRKCFDFLPEYSDGVRPIGIADCTCPECNKEC